MRSGTSACAPGTYTLKISGVTNPSFSGLQGIFIETSRGGVPIDDYLRQWEASCAELKASPLLPARLREMLRIV